MARFTMHWFVAFIWLTTSGAAFAQAADFNGEWIREDGSIVAFSVDNGVFIGRAVDPSDPSESVYGWKPGEIYIEGSLVDGKFAGQRIYRFPVANATRCPAQGSGRADLELELLDPNVVTSRWKNSFLQDDCSVTPGDWRIETYTRRVPVVVETATPEPAPPTTVDAPIDAEKLTVDDLATICPDCIDLAVDYLARKETYPLVKQRWLDLVAEYKGLGGDSVVARMEQELKDLEAALVPPTPEDPTYLGTIADALRKGWRRHSKAVEAAKDAFYNPFPDIAVLYLGADPSWLVESTYDEETGEYLTEADRELLSRADAAETKRWRQMQRRKSYLIKRIALLQDYPRRIAEADAALDMAEKDILRVLGALQDCVRRCQP